MGGTVMLSDTLFRASMFIYAVAALAYLVHVVFRNRAVGVGATLVTIAGFLVQTWGEGQRWRESYQMGIGRIPLTNMYETMIFFSWSIVLIYLIFERIYRNRALGAIATPIAFICIAVGSLFDTQIEALVPALQSNWLHVHVLTSFFGYAAFAISFGVSVAYLVRSVKSGPAPAGAAGEGAAAAGEEVPEFPGLRVLDDVAYKTVMVGFPFLTLGIVTGAAWANYAWGTYWSWDPKETWSLITWLIYAAYLHARFTAGWRGRKTAILSVIGFLAVVFTYFGVNFLLSGLHSYA